MAVQAVTVGRSQGGEVEIMEALREGERVVAQGVGLPNDGDLVRIAWPGASAPLVSSDLPARG